MVADDNNILNISGLIRALEKQLSDPSISNVEKARLEVQITALQNDPNSLSPQEQREKQKMAEAAVATVSYELEESKTYLNNRLLAGNLFQGENWREHMKHADIFAKSFLNNPNPSKDDIITAYKIGNAIDNSPNRDDILNNPRLRQIHNMANFMTIRALSDPNFKLKEGQTPDELHEDIVKYLEKMDPSELQNLRKECQDAAKHAEGKCHNEAERILLAKGFLDLKNHVFEHHIDDLSEIRKISDDGLRNAELQNLYKKSISEISKNNPETAARLSASMERFNSDQAKKEVVHSFYHDLRDSYNQEYEKLLKANSNSSQTEAASKLVETAAKETNTNPDLAKQTLEKHFKIDVLPNGSITVCTNHSCTPVEGARFSAIFKNDAILKTAIAINPSLKDKSPEEIFKHYKENPTLKTSVDKALSADIVQAVIKNDPSKLAEQSVKLDQASTKVIELDKQAEGLAEEAKKDKADARESKRLADQIRETGDIDIPVIGSVSKLASNKLAQLVEVKAERQEQAAEIKERAVEKLEQTRSENVGKIISEHISGDESPETPEDIKAKALKKAEVEVKKTKEDQKESPSQPKDSHGCGCPHDKAEPTKQNPITADVREQADRAMAHNNSQQPTQPTQIAASTSAAKQQTAPNIG